MVVNILNNISNLRITYYLAFSARCRVNCRLLKSNKELLKLLIFPLEAITRVVPRGGCIADKNYIVEKGKFLTSSSFFS